MARKVWGIDSYGHYIKDSERPSRQEKNFTINEYGEIVSLNGQSLAPEDTPERKLEAEYSQLEYEIFSHPDRFTPDELAAKKARYAELEKQLGITKKVDALKAGKDILKKRIAAMNAAQMQKQAEND